MRTLRTIVRERLKSLGRTQGSLAAELGLHESNLSSMLTGERQPPLDQATRWTAVLGLVGAEAVELEEAMYLAAAGERVQAIVARLEAEAERANAALARYRDRIGAVRFILDYVEARPPDEVAEAARRGGFNPAPTAAGMPPAQVLAVVADLLQLRNAIAHGLPLERRVPDAPPEPPPLDR